MPPPASTHEGSAIVALLVTLEELGSAGSLTTACSFSTVSTVHLEFSKPAGVHVHRFDITVINVERRIVSIESGVLGVVGLHIVTKQIFAIIIRVGMSLEIITQLASLLLLIEHILGLWVSLGIGKVGKGTAGRT